MVSYLKVLIATFLIAFKVSATQRPYDIIGIGFSEVSMVSFVDNEYIKRNLAVPYGFRLGSTNFVDEDTWNHLWSQMVNAVPMSVGAISEMLKIYALIAGNDKAGIDTVVVDDEYGLMCKKLLENSGVRFVNDKVLDDNNTIISLGYISPQGEVTTIKKKVENIVQIRQRDVKYHLIKDYKALVVDASLLDGHVQSKAVYRALKIAEKVGTLKIMIVPYEKYVENNLHDFLMLLQDLDIIILSEEYLHGILGTEKSEAFIEQAKNKAVQFVVLEDKDAAFIVKSDGIARVGIDKVDLREVKNRSGRLAGFSAAFLYHLLRENSMEKAVGRGLIAAQHIERAGGAEIGADILREIQK